jgi:hypothetical protein
LRYGDYSTILKFFAYWSAFADFGLYVIAVKRLGALKSRVEKIEESPLGEENREISLKEAKKELNSTFGNFVGTRVVTM